MMMRTTTRGLVAVLMLSAAACSADASGPQETAGVYQGVPTYSGSTGDEGGAYDDGKACKTERLQGFVDGSRYFVALDHSTAMAEDGDPGSAWAPTLDGLSDFFADPAHRSASATLRLFPTNDEATACSGEAYWRAVGDAVVGDQTDRFAALRREAPSSHTVPTRAALEGSLAEAERFVAQNPGQRAHVVLATASRPTGCGDDAAELAALVELVSRSAENVLVHVLTVGHLEGYDAVAAAGRTGRAVELPTRDPDALRKSVYETLAGARTPAETCRFYVPEGRSHGGLAQRSIRVSTLGLDRAETFLPFSPTCANPAGWHYDDVDAPSRVVLCSAACADVSRDLASVAVELSCTPRAPNPF